jgi:2-oxoisovalerate dehydrogenase E1 component
METTYFPQVDDIVDVVTADFFPEKKGVARGVRAWNDLDLARSGL